MTHLQSGILVVEVGIIAFAALLEIVTGIRRPRP